MELDVALRYTVFPLHPDIPDGGILLSDLFPGREAAILDMQAELVRRAAAEGLPMGIRDRTFNSRLAQELGKWAEAKGAGDSFRDAVYRAHFAWGADIGRIEVLVKIAASLGLPEAEARDALEKRSFSRAVDDDWQRALAAGITAVPAHLCRGRRLVGFAGYEDYLRLVAP
jgi:predicted DsbA family dithiol-disulfide isomerase